MSPLRTHLKICERCFFLLPPFVYIYNQCARVMQKSLLASVTDNVSHPDSKYAGVGFLLLLIPVVPIKCWKLASRSRQDQLNPICVVRSVVIGLQSQQRLSDLWANCVGMLTHPHSDNANLLYVGKFDFRYFVWQPCMSVQPFVPIDQLDVEIFHRTGGHLDILVVLRGRITPANVCRQFYDGPFEVQTIQSGPKWWLTHLAWLKKP